MTNEEIKKIALEYAKETLKIEKEAAGNVTKVDNHIIVKKLSDKFEEVYNNENKKAGN